MTKYRWEHFPEIQLGAYTNPYTVWFEVVGRRYKNSQPGDRKCLPDLWIVDYAPKLETNRSWRSLDACDQLGALRIESECPIDTDIDTLKTTATSGKPVDTHTWHRAPLRAESVPGAYKSLAPCPKPGAPCDRNCKVKTIVAIIDDATNFAHHRFRSGDGGSRVDYAWVMDGTAPRDRNSATVPFGREWSNKEIADILDDASNESDVLRQLELEDFAQNETIALSKRISHGTHIMDLAAGFEPGEDIGDSHRIISVQLPRRVILEASGAVLHLFLKAATRYVEARSREIAKQADTKSLPLIINFSYGLGAGSHRGSHPIEKCLSEMTANRDTADPINPVQVVLPAGNRFRADGHARRVADSPGAEALDLDWMIPADDISPNFLEIWLPADAGEPCVEIVSPGQPFGGAARIDLDGGALALASGDTEAPDFVAWAGADTETDVMGNGIGRIRVLVAVAPTRVSRSDAPPAPPGIWQVKVSATLASKQDISAWIQRDDRLFGYRRLGRQSYFVDKKIVPEQLLIQELEEFSNVHVTNGKICGYGSLNGIGTNGNAFIVAGYRWRDQASSHYSSAGSGTVRSPSLSAVSDRSRVLAGVLAAGSRSGTNAVLNGTSVAAPQVARALALRFVDDQPSQAKELTSVNLDTEQTSAPTPVERKANELRGRRELLTPQDRVKSQMAHSFAEDRLVRDRIG
ncbi:hypothetical protein [Ruegeria hyattellae]|uniref:hypothetical protein n=1 Tax=Ruegeria hyattellae TaxID=3233337 RepID=UPI00355BE25A